MINKEEIFSRIKKSGNLPTLPEILVKLLEVCDDDTTPLPEIASVISKDPALSFRVLQLVNSSYYGLYSQFTSIEKAVIYLGANSIKNIAITTSIHQVFDRKRLKAVKQFNICNFWWQSLLCATLSKRIARKVGYGGVDEAYLSGLLHDIGRLILVTTFPKEHESILLETKDSKNELWAEEQLIGITHCEAGSWLIQNWKLNTLVADAIKYHHQSLETIKEAFPLVKIVYVSNLLTEHFQESELCYEAGGLLLELDDTALTEILDGATEEVVHIANDLNLYIKQPFTGSPQKQQLNHHSQSTVESTSEIDSNTNLPLIDQSYNDAVSHSILASRIKSIALLSGFLENLVQAGDSEAIITVFEKSMSILFEIEKVLFFLPDESGVLLNGRTSTSSNLLHLSKGLTLPVKQSSSLIVRAFLQSLPTYLTAQNKRGNLADEQVFNSFRCTTVLFVPIIADKKPAGVILLGLPETIKALSLSDYKLIQVIAQQVGLCLFLEGMKAQKAVEIESEKMAAISMTARKFAHEINNPLGIINNYLTTLQLKLPNQNDILEELGIIREEINRISSMINQMDMLAQSTVQKLEKTNVNAVIEEIIQFVKQPFFNATGVVISFQPDQMLPHVMTSRDSLKQILINLIKNASEAMPEGGTITIRTGIEQKDELRNGTPRAAGIEIIVEDTGPGLPEVILKNLYKPFVSTKKNNNSGLGLSIVQKTVKDLGGYISCSSKPSEGTSFRICLPF